MSIKCFHFCTIQTVCWWPPSGSVTQKRQMSSHDHFHCIGGIAAKTVWCPPLQLGVPLRINAISSSICSHLSNWWLIGINKALNYSHVLCWHNYWYIKSLHCIWYHLYMYSFFSCLFKAEHFENLRVKSLEEVGCTLWYLIHELYHTCWHQFYK